MKQKGAIVVLAEHEVVQLIGLLGKLESTMDRRVFHALMPKIVSVPQELAVLDSENRVLTIYREDAEYVGHHMPGTVLRQGEAVSDAVERLLRTELAGNMIGRPMSIGWMEIRKGTGVGENPTRHEISLIWVARLEGQYHGEGIFSPLNDLPADTLSHHRKLIGLVDQYLKTGRPILGG